MIGKALSDEFDKAERNTVFAYREMLQEMYSLIKDAHLEIDGSLSFPEMTSPVMPCSVVVFTIGLLLLFAQKVNMFLVLFLCLTA